MRIGFVRYFDVVNRADSGRRFYKRTRRICDDWPDAAAT